MVKESFGVAIRKLVLTLSTGAHVLKFINSVITFLVLLLIIMHLLLPKISSQISAKGDPAEPMLLIDAPEIVTVSGNPINFNISVWLNVSASIDVYTYQVKMTANDSILSFENAWTDTQNSSWIFYRLPILPVKPFVGDDDLDGSYESITMGNTLLGSVQRIIENERVLLAIINVRVVGIGNGTLSINNPDTFLINHDLYDVTVGKQDKQVTIEGYLPTSPSTITINVNPATIIVGQNVTFSGKIIPDRSGVNVKIASRHYARPWRSVASVKTDENSQYEYNHTFDDFGDYRIRVSWIGDEIYMPATSEIVNITVKEPPTLVDIKFADGRIDPFIGNASLPLPTLPETLNVTVINVTDLHSWKFTIGYNPMLVRIDDIWLPEDNILALTGLTYNFSFNINNDSLHCEATINQTGQGFSGDGTLFQFTMTGLSETYGYFPTLTIDPQSCIRDSTGHLILFRQYDFFYEILAVPEFSKILPFLILLLSLTAILLKRRHPVKSQTTIF
jgi:hypothetical protein